MTSDKARPATGKTPTKLVVSKSPDQLDDKKIPPTLLMKYGDTFYVLKAGLEWKASKLYGLGGYSLILERLESEPAEELFKATMTVIETGATFVNYGEASTANVNNMMQKQMLHLAATRAECRVLRMATACGYAAYDEVKTIKEEKSTETNGMKDGHLPATENQLITLKNLGGNDEVELTRQQAADAISKLSNKK